MLVNFSFLVSAIFLLEKVKIIQFPAFWQTENGIDYHLEKAGSVVSVSRFVLTLFERENGS